MQKCLNKQHKYLMEDIIEQPIIFLLFIIVIIFIIIAITVGSLCLINKISCSSDATSALLGSGISMTMLVAIFFVIPYFVGCVLNIVYPVGPILRT